MNTKNSIHNIIAIAFLLLVVFAVAYAYFGGIIRTENTVNLSAEMPERLASFMAYSTNPIDLNITTNDLESASTTAVASDTGDVIVKLSSSNNGEIVNCTYDIEFSHLVEIIIKI